MSIFDDNNKVTSNYWKYDTVGDKIEGTYIDRRVTTNRLKPDAEQIVYTLKQPDGIVTDVYGKPGIDAQMKNVKLGQIIGFEFKEEKEATVPGHNNTKIVQVYANPKIVDENWLKGIDDEQAINAAEAVGTPAASVPATPATEAPATPTGTEATPSLEATVKEINNLAVEKLKATTPEDVKAKVMEATGLAFIEGNLPQILELMRIMAPKA